MFSKVYSFKALNSEQYRQELLRDTFTHGLSQQALSPKAFRKRPQARSSLSTSVFFSMSAAAIHQLKAKCSVCC